MLISQPVLYWALQPRTGIVFHRTLHTQLSKACQRRPVAAASAQPDTGMQLTGSCFCRALTYSLKLESSDEARTTLCHCHSCKKAFGTNYGLTAKVSKDAFSYTAGTPKEHKGDTGVCREFCGTCGSYILEYGEAAAPHFRYICVGSLDDPEALPPKGEFFCSQRASWMPEVPGIFHKQAIKE